MESLGRATALSLLSPCLSFCLSLSLSVPLPLPRSRPLCVSSFSGRAQKRPVQQLLVALAGQAVRPQQRNERRCCSLGMKNKPSLSPPDSPQTTLQTPPNPNRCRPILIQYKLYSICDGGMSTFTT